MGNGSSTCPFEIRLIPVLSMPEIVAGDDLGRLILEALGANGQGPEEQDIFVVAHKVVSKAEGRMVLLSEVQPSPEAFDWARRYDRDPRIVELVFREARKIVRMERGIIVAQTRHGFICANCGIDTSNVPPGFALLLPDDPDHSARQLRDRLGELSRVNRLGVVVSDTFGRPWRKGLANVAVGAAGLQISTDYRGQSDCFGNRLKVTTMATIDELAAAAELVMGKTRGIPAVIVRGLQVTGEGAGRDLVRPAEEDLFR